MSMRSVFALAIRCGLIGAAAAACYSSAVLAAAARLFEANTADSVAAAVKLVPNNPRYLARLAALEPDRKAALLQRAVTLSPYDSDSWIQLGLSAEREHGDIKTAEADLLKAAAVDRTYLPRFTLAGFYARRRMQPQFFRWATTALEITPNSPEPVFEEMWRLSRSADRISIAIPNRPAILLQYAVFLTDAREFRAIPPVISRLIGATTPKDAHKFGRDDLIASIEDRLLAENQAGPALTIWNAMQRGGWLHQGIISVDNPITKGDFAVAFYGHGFDWRAAHEEAGISIDRYPGEKALRLTFAGDQPDHAVLLSRYVPVCPGREYRMNWQASSQNISTPSGLSWRIRPFSDSAAQGVSSGDLFAPSATWNFRTPPEADLCVLTLEYARPTGIDPIKRDVTLRSVSMSAR